MGHVDKAAGCNQLIAGVVPDETAAVCSKVVTCRCADSSPADMQTCHLPMCRLVTCRYADLSPADMQTRHMPICRLVTCRYAKLAK